MRSDNSAVIPSYTVILGAPRITKPTITIKPFEEKPAAKPNAEEVAQSAWKLETPRKISVIGDAAGDVIFDGSEDVVCKVMVRTSERAFKDGNGKEIAKTYVKKTELDKYATKSDIIKRLKYIEETLSKTNDSLDNTLSEEDVSFASDDDIDSLFEGD